jgi:hypothetical protein
MYTLEIWSIGFRKRKRPNLKDFLNRNGSIFPFFPARKLPVESRYCNPFLFIQKE